jgi:hypothetical protein
VLSTSIAIIEYLLVSTPPTTGISIAHVFPSGEIDGVNIGVARTDVLESSAHAGISCVVYSVTSEVVITGVVTVDSGRDAVPIVVVFAVVAAGGTQTTICTSDGFSGCAGVITTFDPDTGGKTSSGLE